MGLIYQKEIGPSWLILRKVSLQPYIRIKNIVVVANDPIHPITNIQAKFKGTDLMLLPILKYPSSGNAFHLMQNLIHSIIDPVIMSFCPRAIVRITVRLLHNTELFLCCNGHCIKIQVSFLP